MATEKQAATQQTVAQAILSIAPRIPSLDKSDRNEHGGYNYVSIDDYFDHVARIAQHDGLGWSVRQIDLNLSNDLPKPMMVGTFEFDLFTATDRWNSFFRVTVSHPVQGAQTAGSMLAYAMKMFLRMTFSVVTGEQDADATDPGAYEEKEGPANLKHLADVLLGPGQKVVTENNVPPPLDPPAGVYPPLDLPAGKDSSGPSLRANTIFDLATAFLADCDSEEKLEKYWLENTSPFEFVKTDSPPMYKKLVAAFKAQRVKLQQEKVA